MICCRMSCPNWVPCWVSTKDTCVATGTSCYLGGTPPTEPAITITTITISIISSLLSRLFASTTSSKLLRLRLLLLLLRVNAGLDFQVTFESCECQRPETSWTKV
ncbi:uncharacterized protein LOC112557307 [Pomacea canaliculata]|uniref:uncharacterized protein LOC112557307 n=1 Tax=Pomacea canaliculata TaxID=400727 RepID=UPI000D73BF97|nr:uncharacterized protein LOC112557307 [Pomacea canaliculata]